MKWIKVLMLVGAIGLCHVIYGQSPVSYQRKGWGYEFKSGGDVKTPKQLLSLYKSNSEAYEAMKKANANLAIGQVFGFAGGFLVGWPLGTALAGGEPNWTMAAIGLPLVLISVPLSKGYNKNAIKAADSYNQSISQETASFRMRLGSGKYGYGLVINL